MFDRIVVEFQFRTRLKVMFRWRNDSITSEFTDVSSYSELYSWACLLYSDFDKALSPVSLRF